MLNVDYVVSGIAAAPGQAPDGDGRAGRDAHRAHRLGGDLQPQAGRRVPRARRDRQPDRRLDRQRDRDRSSATARSCGRRTRSTPGRRITAGCGTCTASTAPTTSARGISSRPRCASTRPSRAPMPACRSRISRTPSRAGRSARPEIDRAFEAAGQSLMADDRDPAAHWAMGRALWLRGRQDQSIVELEQAIDLSPNFALGALHAGLRPLAGRRRRRPRSRPPTTRASSARSTRCCSACSARARWRWCASGGSTRPPTGRVKAAARPNAHAHILAIAAYCLALAGRRGRGARPARRDPRERCRATASTISSPRCSSRPRVPPCSGRARAGSRRTDDARGPSRASSPRSSPPTSRATAA